jgi:hypothetical protein
MARLSPCRFEKWWINVEAWTMLIIIVSPSQLNFLSFFFLCLFLWMKANSTKQGNTIRTGGTVNSKANGWLSRPICTFTFSGFVFGTGGQNLRQKRRNNEAFAINHFYIFCCLFLALPWRFNKQLHVSFVCLNRTAGQLLLWLKLADWAVKRRTKVENNRTS